MKDTVAPRRRRRCRYLRDLSAAPRKRDLSVVLWQHSLWVLMATMLNFGEASCREARHVAPTAQRMAPSPTVYAGMSSESLRHIVEDNILDELLTNMCKHHDGVESGELAARPFVTITYAQSIDGSIAAGDKTQVILSGWESRVMTHGLRSVHDAILIGAGTVRQDNPRLNVRHWPPPDENCSDEKAAYPSCGLKMLEEPRPRAVILADSLRELPRQLRLGGAIVFTNLASPDAWRWLAEWGSQSREGSEDRSANDFIVVHCRLMTDGHCDVSYCLEKLYAMGFKSVMVEGGANIISSFLRGVHRDSGTCRGNRLVDHVIVTVAPMFLQGYNVLALPPGGYASPTQATGFPLPLADAKYLQLGKDLVITGTPACCKCSW